MTTTPDALTAEYLAQRWPQLFHMAEAGTWASVQRHGLRSTTALLDLFEVHGAERERLEARRRPTGVAIHHPDHGTAWLRDNKPLIETVLRRTLRGMSEAEFYRTLNGRVFLWLTKERLATLQRAYRDRRHDVLVLDTAKLLERYADVVELSPINSGAVHPGATITRGAGTFTRIADYPWAQRRRTRADDRVVELTVPYAVPDIADLVVDVRHA